MRKVEKYTGEKTYMFPSGRLATPEAVMEQFPAALSFAHIVETDDNGEVMFAFNNLSAMRSMHQIDKDLSEEEAIAAIEEKINTPEPVPEPEPSAEERIAAAMEYQNLMSL